MSEFISKSDFDDAFEEALNRKVENTYFNGENIPIVGNRENTDWSTTFDPVADIKRMLQEPSTELSTKVTLTPQLYDALVTLNDGLPFYHIDHQMVEVL